MISLADNFTRIYNSYKADFSGAVLIADTDNALFSGVSGFANRDFNVMNTIDTKFDTASVTKTFTAVAVLQLIENGRLHLADRITDIVDLAGTKIPGDVTIEHLLTHTSGIADDADEEAGEDYSDLFIDKPNYAIRECKDHLPNFAYKEPLLKAGTNVRYNNCAFVLLGIAIENITGKTYKDFVTANIFERCGMSNSCFQAKDDVCPNTAEGYYAVTDENNNFVKWKKNIYSYPPIGTADGGAFTTVGDLNIFIRALKGGALLSPEYTDMVFRPHCDFTRPYRHGTWRMGYAFEFIEANSNGEIFCMYKEGCNSGVDAIFAYYPKLDLYLGILSNQSGPLWQMYREMGAVIFEHFAKAKP